MRFSYFFLVSTIRRSFSFVFFKNLRCTFNRFVAEGLLLVCSVVALFV